MVLLFFLLEYRLDKKNWVIILICGCLCICFCKCVNCFFNLELFWFVGLFWELNDVFVKIFIVKNISKVIEK